MNTTRLPAEVLLNAVSQGIQTYLLGLEVSDTDYDADKPQLMHMGEPACLSDWGCLCFGAVIDGQAYDVALSAELYPRKEEA